jgi:glycerol-3-phosphate acyltransferase PlsY
MTWTEHLQSANWFQATGSVLGAYLLGCFANGYYLVRARTGKDIREIGSGSTGARNVAREWTNNHHLAALAMLAVVAGHLWPAQLRFRGGKGVSTSLGALLAFDYRIALTFAVLFLAGFVVMRKTIFPVMFAFACLPLASLWFNRDGLTATLAAVLLAMILFAHRRNIGEEIAALPARRGVVPKPEPPKL